MKKMTFILSVFSFFAIASTAYAQGFVPLAPIPGLTEGVTANTAGLSTFFNNLYKYLIGLAAALAVIQITWAGLDIAIWHKDAVSAITDDKEKIYNAVFGLILVLSPVLVFSIINPSILNLSLSLPELKTTSGTSTGTGAGTGTQLPTTTDPATGCSVTGGTYFKTLSCQSQDAAKNYRGCTNDSILQVNPCKILDGTGKCKDTSFTAYCIGKSPTLTFYYYYSSPSWGVTKTSEKTPVPSQKSGFNDFLSRCSGDGGVPEDLQKVSSKQKVDCGSEITIDTSIWKGAHCFTSQLACNAPN